MEKQFLPKLCGVEFENNKIEKGDPLVVTTRWKNTSEKTADFIGQVAIDIDIFNYQRIEPHIQRNYNIKWSPYPAMFQWKKDQMIETAAVWRNSAGTQWVGAFKVSVSLLDDNGTRIPFICKDGGGTILLPEGTYYLNGHQEAGDIPGDENGLNTACIYIQYGNIELKGAGIDKTFLVTPSEFKIINNTVQRVHGIRVIPAKDTTIENLVFKDFDLYGGFHGTGNIHWPANTETGDGWDIMHKGFAFFNRGVKNVEFDHVCIHGYSGEILYCGAQVERLTMRYCKTYDTNGQCFNGQAHDTLVEHCQLGHPDYISNTWIEYANINEFKALGDATFVFRNCYFTHNELSAISFNEGHNDNYRLTFENNVFDLCNGIRENGAHM